jgi:hypothetical protein
MNWRSVSSRPESTRGLSSASRAKRRGGRGDETSGPGSFGLMKTANKPRTLSQKTPDPARLQSVRPSPRQVSCIL